MGFIKLSNPKPGAAIVPVDGVSVSCRSMRRTGAKKNGEPSPTIRFVQITIGAGIGRKAGFSGKGKADVVIGEGLERCRCGITANPLGAFKLRQLKSGNYQLSIGEGAGAGLLDFAAPSFIADAELVTVVQGGMQCVMFDLSEEIRA